MKFAAMITRILGSAATDSGPSTSRRAFLVGLGAAGLAATGVASLVPSTARAEDTDDGEYQVAQRVEGSSRRDNRRDDRRDRREDRRVDRRDRREDRRDNRRDRRDRDRPQFQSSRQRYSRRDLRNRCRSDGRFRRNNPSLCRRVVGPPGRRGTCIELGPVLLCD